MKTLCVIPARGGSKGIARKNLSDLGGLPLLHWVCKKASLVHQLDDIIVSTDDAEIAEAARQAGVAVPFMRSATLAGDTSPVVHALIDALERMEQGTGTRYDWLCLLQPTSPFVEPADIEAALTLAKEKSAETVLSVYPVGQMHPDIMLELNDQQQVQWLTATTNRMSRRQDLSPVYARAGAVYIISRETLLKSKSIYGNAIYAVPIDKETAFSIDSPFDLLTAQTMLDHGLVDSLSAYATKQSSGADDRTLKQGSIKSFDANWKSRKEAHYTHWTRNEPQNQIQLAFRNHWTLFCELLGRTDGAGKRCLEVGCGRGTMSCYFADAGYDCTLLDTSESILKEACHLFDRHGLKGSFDVGDANFMVYPDNSFDVIVSIGLLEHFESIAQPLKEQWRVLRPGGTVFVYAVPDKRVSVQENQEWINDLLRALMNNSNQVQPTKDDVFRNTYGIQPYIDFFADLGAQEAKGSGVYPLPMISHCPAFPFTLLPDAAERVLVDHFQALLEKRREQYGRHPWLCKEEEGQSLLIWAKK